MATLSALQTEILAYGFDSTAYTSRITTWLNEAQRQIARILDIPLLEQDQTLTLVAGTNGYAVAATFQRLEYVANDTDDNMLQRISEVEYEELDHTERGTPMYYFLKAGTTVTLYPAPDAGAVTKTIRVHYIGLPTAMAAAGDTTGFSADYDLVLKAYALAEAYAAEDDAAMSNFWSGKFRERLLTMGEDLGHPDNSGPNQIPGAWNW